MMNTRARLCRIATLLLVASALLSACNDDDENVSFTPTGNTPDTGNGGQTAPPRLFSIAPGDNATADAVAAFFEAAPGDTIEFEPGFFEFNTGLVMQNTEGVTVKGAGMDETVLSFENSDTAEGFLISNVRGVVVSDLTVTDTPGDGIKIKSSDIVTYRNVRTMWSSADTPVGADNYQSAIHYECPAEPIGVANPAPYQPDSGNGRYGIYPVQASNVLLDNVESLGASDAGIYVGQSDDVIIKNSRALYNVAGYEFENTQRAEMFDNIAECNTVGYIIYDLPYLTQYGYQARMHHNVARNNNFENFAAGGIVSQVPKGSGLITLAYDQVEVDHNEFSDHQTGAILITSYELIGDDGDLRQDIYTEALSIHDNSFDNSGYAMPPPDLAALAEGDLSSALPTIIALKNGGQGADIIWDGVYDGPNECPKPDVPTNDRGKPQFEGTDVKPANCGDADENGIADRYNAYKFDDSDARKKPSMWICIENNSYTGSPLAPEFANIHGLAGLEALNAVLDPEQLGDPNYLPGVIAGIPDFLADNDATPHQCQSEFGETLPGMPAVQLATYTLPEGGSGRPSEEQIAALCGRETDGAINWQALAEVDCPDLASYHLFNDPQDPSTDSNGGTPYDLNTRLFSDYAVKYRFVFMPEGTAAVYHNGSEDVNATYDFPVGTVISKTFSFIDGGNTRHVETRLLIKREDDKGVAWVGLPYIWETDGSGKRIARLSKGGGTAAVSWNYNDAHSGELLQGSTDSYRIPNASQCVTCHANTYNDAGAAPIGPKPRNLNKPYAYEGAGNVNQIAYWVDHNLLTGAPSDLGVDVNTMIATQIERIPYFNVPGDGGETANSDADIEQRIRGYLEVNCAHCHNEGGAASNTGLYLDYFRPVNSSYGICKTPTAAGAGSDGRPHDIQPGSTDESIMPFRVGSNDVEARMPPIARSVVHEEALELLDEWIENVVDSDYEDGSCATAVNSPTAMR
ncbi:parallel beta-helix domain-containing protein [Salinisphaera sp. S4-8]|uniref:parallel beta-helix domain-containing protein n=1 Tax=Salinisphaera sp. S4-8 TaxID=633357 RepID=UPI0033406CCF